MIYSVGSGGSGILCLNDFDDHSTPQECQLKAGEFDFGGSFGLAINDGYVYQWGAGRNIPRQLFKAVVVSLSCGWEHALILTTEQLLGLGSNKFSQMPILEQKYYDEPTPIIFNQQESVKSVYCGFRQSFLILQDQVQCFGQNKNNELAVQGKVDALKCGQRFTLALVGDKLYGCGDSSFGQLAQQGKQLGYQLLMENVAKFDCGWSHHIVLLKDGTILITGRGQFGQQGDGKMQNNYGYVQIPIQGRDVKCGSESTYIISDDRYYVTGWNEHGNLGLGHQENVYQFKEIKQKVVNIQASGASVIIRAQYPSS